MKLYTMAEIMASIDNANELHLDRYLLPRETTSADDDILLVVHHKLFGTDQYRYQRQSGRYFASLNY